MSKNKNEKLSNDKNERLNNGELSSDELNQVAGGKVDPRIYDDIPDPYEDDKPSWQKLFRDKKSSFKGVTGGSVYY